MKIKNILFLMINCRSISSHNINSNKIIKNMHIPSCKNCIYYKPSSANDFTSTLNKCEKFGEKNIITDEITYTYADTCRHDENLCGKEGHYFEKEKNIDLKIMKHKITRNLPNIFLILALLLSVVRSIL